MAPNPIILRHHFGNLCIKGLKHQDVLNWSIKAAVSTCSTSHNRVTLTFDILISGSTSAKRLSRSVRLPSLVLIAQAVFLSERGHKRQTDTQTKSQTQQITLS